MVDVLKRRRTLIFDDLKDSIYDKYKDFICDMIHTRFLIDYITLN